MDGGYFDNLPINMALHRGADQIIAIDLWNSPTHGRYMDRPGILYIHPSRPLGGMLMFEPKLMENSRCLGYLDTLPPLAGCGALPIGSGRAGAGP